MAGPVPARAGGRVVADLDRSGACASHDRRVYARGLAEYLLACEREGVDPIAATRAQIALFVRELRTRPSRRGTNVVAMDSGSCLANATLQQRLVRVRLFYDFLVEEGSASPTRSVAGVTRRAATSVGSPGRSSRGWSSCRGSPARPIGCSCLTRSGSSRSVAG